MEPDFLVKIWEKLVDIEGHLIKGLEIIVALLEERGVKSKQ
jgi:hypothetical protein